jgi:hypothetical protein
VSTESPGFAFGIEESSFLQTDFHSLR